MKESQCLNVRDVFERQSQSQNLLQQHIIV